MDLRLVKGIFRQNRKFFQIILAAFALLIAMYFYVVPIDSSMFAGLGYLGVFLGTAIANATIIVPGFHMVLTFAAATKLNPLLVAILAGAGMTLGELTGYFFGIGASTVVTEKKWYKKISKWMRVNGWLTIFLLAFIPNLVFDLAGIVAGSTRFKIRRFITATFLGKLGRSFLISYLGAFLG